MEQFLDSAGPRLPTLRGLKYTDTNLFEFGRCVTAQAEKYQIIYGSDQVHSWLISMYIQLDVSIRINLICYFSPGDVLTIYRKVSNYPIDSLGGLFVLYITVKVLMGKYVALTTCREYDVMNVLVGTSFGVNTPPSLKGQSPY